MKRGTLIISRHGQSEWNLLDKYTGWADVGLTEKGKSDTRQLGLFLQDKDIDAVYVSALQRTHQTLDALMEGAGKKLRATDQQVKKAKELNERDYGDLTGKNKQETKKEIGEEAFANIRRGWDYPVPGGETLKDTYGRVVPYFKAEILPLLWSGKNVLIVSHGNAIRALIKYLDRVPDDEINTVEVLFGQLLEYSFVEGDPLPVKKRIHRVNT